MQSYRGTKLSPLVCRNAKLPFIVIDDCCLYAAAV